MVTDPYPVPQSSLVTILKELVKVKETNKQLRKNIQQMPSKQNPTQLTATKLTFTPKTLTTRTSAIGKKTV